MSAYNMLEAFIEGRLKEISDHVNRGPLHFADLPDKLQELATQHLLEVTAARARRMDKSDVRTFVGAAGESLAAVNGAINLSWLSWLWTGSNMATADYARLLRVFHVAAPWREIDLLAARLHLPAGTPEVDLKAFAQERHRAAHDAAHKVSNLWIPVAIEHLVKFSLAFDAIVSVAAQAMRRGDAAYLSQPDWTAGRVGIRWVRERPGGWAAYSETSTKALRVGSDLHTVTIYAASRCADEDLLVTTDLSGQVIDWSIPVVG